MRAEFKLLALFEGKTLTPRLESAFEHNSDLVLNFFLFNHCCLCKENHLGQRCRCLLLYCASLSKMYSYFRPRRRCWLEAQDLSRVDIEPDADPSKRVQVG